MQNKTILLCYVTNKTNWYIKYLLSLIVRQSQKYGTMRTEHTRISHHSSQTNY